MTIFLCRVMRWHSYFGENIALFLKKFENLERICSADSCDFFEDKLQNCRLSVAFCAVRLTVYMNEDMLFPSILMDLVTNVPVPQ